jgi:hypothetical protein
MDSTPSSNMSKIEQESASEQDWPGENPQATLSALFGGYKAEWLRGRLFELYSEPAYFPELTQPRPCVLVGGRGTGKTTALRSLSYEGQYALSSKRAESINDWRYYGLYYRVNTSRVTAFTGSEVEPTVWIRLFSHYMNIALCELGLRFLGWYALHFPDAPMLSADACTSVAASLNLTAVESTRDLASAVSSARIAFEAFINNVADAKSPPLSALGAPVDALFEEIGRLPQFSGKLFYFLIDEYENFLDDQQKVVNTLLKHAGGNYTFKIGVRELGWRQRNALGDLERLVSPADYVHINIADKLEGEAFRTFARNVCNQRLAALSQEHGDVISDVRIAFPGLAPEEEAELLGVGDRITATREALTQQLDASLADTIRAIPPLQLYVLQTWAESHHETILDAYLKAAANPTEWQTRYENYKYAFLFSLKRGKRGIRKYYAGWDTYLLLAANNIRYLLELVEQSLHRHVRDGGSLASPVSPKDQTLSAQAVGKKNLSELEGLDVSGAKLTKLLLGLGRVFQVMAEDPAGRTPEVNQFTILPRTGDVSPLDNSSDDALADALLRAGVMHLALLRAPGSKLTDVAETREYDYMPHPIFSAYFGFSHRRKRKMQLTPQELIGLVNEPKSTIREVLARSGRTVEDEVPEQLLLFEAYYGGNS